MALSLPPQRGIGRLRIRVLPVSLLPSRGVAGEKADSSHSGAVRTKS
jgi:hypothetical protein